MKDGSKFLKVTSILEIIAGIASILLIHFLLVTDGTVVILSEPVEVTALWSLILIYGINAFKILAGILGLCLSNKKSILTMILGVLLIAAHSTNFMVGEFTVLAIIIDVIPVIIPAYYFYGAYKNYISK